MVPAFAIFDEDTGGKNTARLDGISFCFIQKKSKAVGETALEDNKQVFVIVFCFLFS